MLPSLATVVPARDRCLPVDEPFEPLLPDGGLRRGHVVGCGGVAAMSLALGLVARPVAAGSWLAVVGVPMLGIEAVAETGVPLDRVVAVDVGGGPGEWAERVAAAIDGFEVVLTRLPAGAHRHLRKVGHRLQARGGVLVPVSPGGPPPACDVELTTRSVEWSGADRGAGHLVGRRARIRSGGRRMPRPVEVDLWLPGPDGRVSIARPAGHLGAVAAGAAEHEPVEVVALDRAG